MSASVVACVGIGVIGSSWAVSFARAGHAVRLYDTSSEARDRSLDVIGRTLASLEAERDATADAALRRISVSQSLEEAVVGADFVQESAREDLGTKQALFAALDAAAPEECILASSTSEIPARDFTASLPGRARCLVAHPLNPPHLIPLVELCGSPWTSASTLARARAFFEAAGHEPIVLKREVPGFVANRLQVAVIIEALRLVDEGYCDVADVDMAMRRGLGMRWALMGPFETNRVAAANGYGDFLRDYWPTLHSIGRSLDASFTPSAGIGYAIEATLAQGANGASPADQAAWRDRSLIRLRQLLDALGRPAPRRGSSE